MKYRKKPVIVEAITFEELVEYGKANGANIVNGMPWSFHFRGHPVSHENDDCYLITTPEETLRMARGDVLVVGTTGALYVEQQRPTRKVIRGWCVAVDLTGGSDAGTEYWYARSNSLHNVLYDTRKDCEAVIKRQDLSGTRWKNQRPAWVTIAIGDAPATGSGEGR